MVRCDNCRKKTAIPFVCKSCKKEHCTACRHLDIHKCENIDEALSSEKELLKNELMKFKTEEIKIIKI